MDGRKTLDWLKAHPKFSSIPVVMVSTTSSIEDISKLKNAGAMEFIVKPNRFDALPELLKPLLTVEM